MLTTELLIKKNMCTHRLPNRQAKKKLSASRSKRYGLAAEKISSVSTRITVVNSLKISSFNRSYSSDGRNVAR